MKTPKRHIELTTMNHDGLEMVWDNSQWNVSTQRWKRKNRVKQLKRTIARLTAESRELRELWIGGHLNFDSPEWEVFMILRKLKTPAEDATLEEKLDHWLTLRKAAAKALDAACFAAKAYGEAKAKENAACLSETAEYGSSVYLSTPTATFKARSERFRHGNKKPNPMEYAIRYPTPTASDYKRCNQSEACVKNKTSKWNQVSLPEAVQMETQTYGPLNPDWVEWLMGCPVAWTDLKPLATDKFLSWLQSHSRHCAAVLKNIYV